MVIALRLNKTRWGLSLVRLGRLSVGRFILLARFILGWFDLRMSGIRKHVKKNLAFSAPAAKKPEKNVFFYFIFSAVYEFFQGDSLEFFSMLFFMSEIAGFKNIYT